MDIDVLAVIYLAKTVICMEVVYLHLYQAEERENILVLVYSVVSQISTTIGRNVVCLLVGFGLPVYSCIYGSITMHPMPYVKVISRGGISSHLSITVWNFNNEGFKLMFGSYQRLFKIGG